MVFPNLKAALLALIGVVITACGPQVERPPSELQADRHSMVTFTSDPDAACRGISTHKGEARILGCEFHSALVVPNPCGVSGAYADLLCHELGHANGWNHD